MKVEGFIYSDADNHDWNAGFRFDGSEDVLSELLVNLQRKGFELIIRQVGSIKIKD